MFDSVGVVELGSFRKDTSLNASDEKYKVRPN